MRLTPLQTPFPLRPLSRVVQDEAKTVTGTRTASFHVACVSLCVSVFLHVTVCSEEKSLSRRGVCAWGCLVLGRYCQVISYDVGPGPPGIGGRVCAPVTSLYLAVQVSVFVCVCVCVS